MKSRKKIYELCKIGGQIALVAAILVACAYSSTRGFMSIAGKHDRALGPKEIISATHPLETHIYFNNEVGESRALDILIEKIRKAQHSVEIAMFSFGSDDMKRALYAANARGVKVTLVLDKSKYKQHDALLSDLPIGIQRIEAGAYDPVDSRNTTYMHDKFMIIDRDLPSEELATGSLNFTTWGEKYNQSFFLVTKDADIISVYKKEFDLLKSRTSGIKKLGVTTYNPWAATINYSDSFLEIWFSPGFSSQSIKYRLLDTINASEKNIDIIIWDFTDQQIASALVKKAREGIKVRIITEDQTSLEKNSVIPYLRKMKDKEHLDSMEILLDTKLMDKVTETVPEDFSPLIHHHSLIADGKTLIFGSGNWSLWGFYNNDENAFVTNNAYLVEESQKTFDYFYKTLK